MISIITLTYGDRADVLKNCIESILKHTKEEFEYFIVDNCSSQRTRNVISVYSRLPGITWILLDKNEGTSARNHALKRAIGNIIVNVDDDVVVCENYIQSMMKYLDDKTSLVGPQGALYDPNGELGFFGTQDVPVGSYVDFVTSWICLYRMGEWQYDPNLFSLRDESDLQLQMKEKGWRLRKSECAAFHNCIRNYELGKQTFNKDNEYFVNKWKEKKDKIRWESHQ